MSANIDLSKLPAPSVVEALSWEDILQAMLTDLQARDPAFTALVESDPAYKILEVAAYRELLLRQRVNDAARAVMLPYATGSDLDALAALFNLGRAAGEDDDSLRQRALLAPEAYSVAGPAGAYRFHALNADSRVKDVMVQSPSPGFVNVVVLSSIGDGTPTQDILDAVTAALTNEKVRPLTDTVTVQAAQVLHYSIDVALTLYNGPDAELVRQASADALQAFADSHHRLGFDHTLALLMAAAMQPGVQNAAILTPTNDTVVQPHQAAYADTVTVTVIGTDE